MSTLNERRTRPEIRRIGFIGGVAALLVVVSVGAL